MVTMKRIIRPTGNPASVSVKMENDLKRGVIKSWISSTITYAFQGQSFGFESKIHRIVLSVEKAKRAIQNVSTITNAIGRIHEDKSFHPDERSGFYGKKFISNKRDLRIYIFAKPLKPFIPPSRIEIYPADKISLGDYKKYLNSLNSIAGLRVSSVEYAIDQYCWPSYVEHLFCLELRYLYFPYQRKANLYGGTALGVGTRLNMVCHFGNRNKWKLYERGKDKDKDRIRKGWQNQKLGRVRLEHTATRERLRKHGINTLSDFMRGPKFYELNKGLWHFKKFEGSSRLPNECDEYDTGVFQKEYFAAKEKVSNRAQYLGEAEAKDVRILRERLLLSMQVFDRQWSAPNGRGYIIRLNTI